MAEALLDLPPGVPLGGYTGRCNCFGNEGEVDKRGSAYVNNFNPSAGVQTRPAVQVLWLENGDQAIAMGQTDAIYIYEGIVLELERRLVQALQLVLLGQEPRPLDIAREHRVERRAMIARDLLYPRRMFGLGEEQFHGSPQRTS